MRFRFVGPFFAFSAISPPTSDAEGHRSSSLGIVTRASKRIYDHSDRPKCPLRRHQGAHRGSHRFDITTASRFLSDKVNARSKSIVSTSSSAAGRKCPLVRNIWTVATDRSDNFLVVFWVMTQLSRQRQKTQCKRQVDVG